jgi:hypothetical protein
MDIAGGQLVALSAHTRSNLPLILVQQGPYETLASTIWNHIYSPIFTFYLLSSISFSQLLPSMHALITAMALLQLLLHGFPTSAPLSTPSPLLPCSLLPDSSINMTSSCLAMLRQKRSGRPVYAFLNHVFSTM